MQADLDGYACRLGVAEPKIPNYPAVLKFVPDDHLSVTLKPDVGKFIFGATISSCHAFYKRLLSLIPEIRSAGMQLQIDYSGKELQLDLICMHNCTPTVLSNNLNLHHPTHMQSAGKFGMETRLTIPAVYAMCCHVNPLNCTCVE